MIGLVLGAGRGSRLGPLAAECPKLLMPVDDGRTILDVTLANFVEVGISDVVVVAGYRIDRLMDQVPRLEDRYGLELTLVANPYFALRNNCYSLLCARRWFGEEVLLANGDTLHHSDIDALLVGDRSDSAIVLAVQRGRKMGDEEMKVAVGQTGLVTALSKEIDPEGAHGEYIGVARLRPAGGADLIVSLLEVVARTPHLYYEDAFTHFAQAGGTISAVDIGELPWQEIDTEADLEEARRLACLC